jgi:hypothetical protein
MAHQLKLRQFNSSRRGRDFVMQTIEVCFKQGQQIMAILHEEESDTQLIEGV